jgi:hypothetical protein
MSKNSLTLKRGATTVIAEGRFAIACLTAMVMTYFVFAPIRLVGQGFNRITGGFLTHDNDD